MTPKFFIKEVTEEDYNPLSISSLTSFHQAFFYGEWQKKMGRRVRRFKIEKNEQPWGFFQLIVYPLIFNKTYGYIPHGPVIAGEPEKEFLEEFRKLMIKILKQENAVFVRFDFFPEYEKVINRKGYRKTPAHSYHSSAFQSKFNWVVEINKTPEELLDKTHSKTRYRIRYAQKHGVEAEVVRGEEMRKYLDKFHELMSTTADRALFSLHPKKYYQVIFEDAVSNPDIELVFSKYEGKILAMYIILHYGDTTFYPLGGSSREHKELMPTYITHWQAILEGQKRGKKLYNFGTVNVGDKVYNKMWEGITEFKTRFKGRILPYSDSYDIVGQPFWYFLYNFRKKIRPPVHKKALKVD